MLTRKKNLAILIAAILINTPAHSISLSHITISKESSEKYSDITTGFNIINDGTQVIEGDNVMYDTIINNNGEQYVTDGGESNNITINDQGFLSVSKGGVANNVTINGRSYVYFAMASVTDGGTLNNVTLTSVGSEISIRDGGVVNDAVVKEGSISQYGGEVNNTIVENINNNARSLTIYGGEANNTAIESGYVEVKGSYAVANDSILNGGNLQVKEGIANNTIVNGGGIASDRRGCV